jgi:hypothetical protein
VTERTCLHPPHAWPTCRSANSYQFILLHMADLLTTDEAFRLRSLALHRAGVDAMQRVRGPSLPPSGVSRAAGAGSLLGTGRRFQANV